MVDEQEERKGKTEEKDDSTEAASSKASPVKWIIVGVVVVALGVGGYFGYSQFMKKDPADATAEKKSRATASRNKATEVRIIYPLESFIVNLKDKAGSGKRYLKVTVELEVGSLASKAKLGSYSTQLRDTILLLLSGLSFDEINSIEGKLDLKQSLLARTNQLLGSGTIRRIYFTEFVVQ
ncbi:MAG: flagellar basal body-associated FliL family protein [Desulfobacterales bacterium]